MPAPAARLTDHDLADMAEQLRREYAGAIPPERVLEVVLESAQAMRRWALSGGQLSELLQQAVRRTLVHEIASAGLDLELAPEDLTGLPAAGLAVVKAA
ncbi:MAG TPA: hypothetical protein VK925_05295 [Jiangellaceae bacterium]|nr:hypothetical protein [Jiangellaceae bacterium]